MRIDTYFDGFLWVALLGGDYLGRFATQDEAFAFAYAEKCRIAGVPCE